MNKVKYNKYRDLRVILEVSSKKHLVYSFFIALLILCVFINISSAAISYHNTAYGTMLYKQDMADIREIVNYSDNSFNIIANSEPIDFNIIANSEPIDAVLYIHAQDLNGNPMANLDVDLYYYPTIYEDNMIDSATTNESGIASFDVSTESIELRNITGVPLANTAIEISLNENQIWTGTTNNNGIAIISGLDDDTYYEVYFDLPDTYCSTNSYIFTGYDKYYTVTATPNGIYHWDGSNSWCLWFTVSPDWVYQPGIDTVLEYTTDLPYDELVYTIVDYSTIDDYNYKQSIHQTESTVHLPELPTGYYTIFGKIEHDDTILDIQHHDMWIYDSNSYPEYDISISYPSTAVDNNLVISIIVTSNTGKIIGRLIEDNNEDNYGSFIEWGYCCGPGESSTEEQNVQAVPYSDGYINLTILLYDGPNVWHTVINDVYAQNTNEPVTLVFDVEYNSGTANNPPIASFTYVPKNPAVGQQISFTASSSYDPDGNIVSYDWDFEDGNSGSGVNPTHAYAQDGTYTVTLTVTDNDGATDSNSTTVVVGNIAPIVTIHSPLSVTNDSTPLLYATFEEIVASTWYVIDGAAGTGGLNTDNLTVTLPELADGSHSVTVKASDSVGNVGNATQNFLVDTIKPVVTIYPVTSPTNVSFQTITGTFTESGSGIALITVNGVEATISDSTYSATISLTEGTNSVYVIAVDIAGNSDLNTTSIVLDTIPPTITIDAVSSPTNIDYQTVTGTIESGATIEVTCLTAAVGTVTTTDTTWSVEITGMDEGDNVITATATDQAGNKASDTATIVVDPTLPTITIKPVTSPTKFDYQTIMGAMENGATVAVTCSTATVGTVTYPTDITWSVEIKDMTEGDNVINATATDQADNKASDTATIVLDKTLPSINSVTLNDIVVQTGAPIEVTVDAWDDNGIDSVTADGTLLTFNGTHYVGTITVGTSPVTVNVTDEAGNLATDTSTAYTIEDIEPTINSITLNDTIVQTGAPIEVTVNATDDNEIVGVTADGTLLTLNGEYYVGTITAGTSPVIVIVTDEAGNLATNTSVTYTIDDTEPELIFELITEGNVSTLYINSSEPLLNCTVNNVKH